MAKRMTDTTTPPTIAPEVVTLLREWDRCEQAWRGALGHVRAAEAVAARFHGDLQRIQHDLRSLIPGREFFVQVDALILRVAHNGYGEVSIDRVVLATPEPEGQP